MSSKGKAPSEVLYGDARFQRKLAEASESQGRPAEAAEHRAIAEDCERQGAWYQVRGK
jgi:hypothetical protein